MRKAIDRSKDQGGFTLIELLIVIIILGILVAIVIFGVSTFRRNAAESACKTDLKQVKTAAAAYVAKHGTSAANSTALVTDGLLESYPTSSQYTIVYTKTGGTYTVESGAPPAGVGLNCAGIT